MLRYKLFGIVALIVTSASAFAAPGEARLLRFPAIHGDQIVFTYAGDLYTVVGRGRHGPPAHVAPRFRDVPAVLARRQADRLHRRSTTATPKCS